MKILVLGSGGREHALVHTFARYGHEVYCLPGNGGTESLCRPLPEHWQKKMPLADEDILALAHEMSIDLTVVGPEDYLERGIVDLFQESGKHIFGPAKLGARLESSKAYSKAFMDKYSIPTAAFTTCSTSKKAREVIKTQNPWKGLVVKPSGLTAGKGVACCETALEALEAVSTIMEHNSYGSAGKEVVLEELLAGREVSILAFCDGERMLPLISAQDHKRLLDGDIGPNTGGVGAYAPTPFIDEAMEAAIYEKIILPTLNGLKEEGICYKGILYFGLMLTAEGPKVLEYNCRFGDPETQSLLPLLDEDLAAIMLSCCKGCLIQKEVQWKNLCSCCVVMTSEGYPGKFSTGRIITGLENTESGAIIFHAGTKRLADGAIVTSGGRVLSVTGLGFSLAEAAEKAYSAINHIHFENACYRSDIGYQALEPVICGSS